jgi:hypothetical protein
MDRGAGAVFELARNPVGCQRRRRQQHVCSSSLGKPVDREVAPAKSVEVEYRLACSGELYNRNVLTADWRKSDVTRILLRTPFELFVASQPFAHYLRNCASA